MWFHGKIPWNKYETPDDGFSPPPEVSDHHLEMKNADTLNIWSALKQAEGDARKQKKKKWAVIFTRSYRKTYVAIPYDQWKRSL